MKVQVPTAHNIYHQMLIHGFLEIFPNVTECLISVIAHKTSQPLPHLTQKSQQLQLLVHFRSSGWCAAAWCWSGSSRGPRTPWSSSSPPSATRRWSPRILTCSLRSSVNFLGPSTLSSMDFCKFRDVENPKVHYKFHTINLFIFNSFLLEKFKEFKTFISIMYCLVQATSNSLKIKFFPECPSSQTVWGSCCWGPGSSTRCRPTSVGPGSDPTATWWLSWERQSTRTTLRLQLQNGTCNSGFILSSTQFIFVLCLCIIWWI